MKRLGRTYERSAEFLARQGRLFDEIAQGAASVIKAELRTTLQVWKDNWRKWFPPAAPKGHQLVLESDDLAQVPLFSKAFAT